MVNSRHELCDKNLVFLGVTSVLVRFSFLLLLVCSYHCSAAETKHYVVEARIADNHYITNLLRLILNASKAPDEVIDLKFNKLYDLQLSHSRRLAEFSKLQGNVVMWTVTNKDREAFLRPIRVPIFKGLFGYRCLVIRKADQAKFAAIKTQRDLAMLAAGQGEQWPDTGVLRANGFSVVTGTQTENLYKMLAAKRFDYFPRALVEINSELEFINTYNLMIEPNIMLEYPNPLYFFVQQTNTELAERMERGWKIILANGSFDELFFKQQKVKDALFKWLPHVRYIAHLKTPDLPEDTPLQELRQWFHLSSSYDLPP